MTDERYARAEQLQDTDPREAVRLCLEVAEHPNALNLAGYLLTTRLRGEEGALDRGLALLERARRVDPENPFVLPNLGTALVRAGRGAEALRVLEDALTQALPRHVELRASNWLGWQLLQRGDVERAVLPLERAVRLDARFAPARFNLAGAFVALGRHAEALEHVRWAFFGEGLHDVAGALALRGEAYEGLGQLRRALGAFRRARAWAAAALDERASHYAVLAGKLVARLREAGVYFPAEQDEARWLELEAAGGLRALSDGLTPAEHLRIAPLEALLPAAEREGLSPELAARLRTFLQAPTLPPSLAGVSLPVEGTEGAQGELMRRWPELHLALYQRDLSRAEPQPKPTRFEAQVLASLSSGAHDEALRLLETEVGRQHPADLLPLVERERSHALLEGRTGHARRYGDLALQGWRAWASEATSGAEGAERMAAVREAEARYAREAP